MRCVKCCMSEASIPVDAAGTQEIAAYRGAENRMDLVSDMPNDKRLRNACAYTCIALMGFPSVRAFREWSAKLTDEQKSDGRIDLVHNWLNPGDSSTGPMSTGVVATPTNYTKQQMATLTEDRIREIWKQPLPGGVYRMEAVDRVHAAIAPLLSMDESLSESETALVDDQVHNLVYALPGAGKDAGLIDADQAQQFLHFVRECKENSNNSNGEVAIPEFAALVRAIVRGVPRTLKERAAAAVAASRFFGLSEKIASSESAQLKTRLRIAAREHLPDVLGREQFQEWLGHIPALVEGAKATLGTPADGDDMVMSLYNTVLDESSGRPRIIVNSSERGSIKLIEAMSSIFRASCMEVSSGVESSKELHTAATNILQDIRQPKEYFDIVNGTSADKWHQANMYVLLNSSNGTFVNAMKSIMSIRLNSMPFPTELKNDIAKAYNDATCAGMHEVLRKVALVTRYAPHKPSDGAGDPSTDEFRDQLLVNVLEIGKLDLQARLASLTKSVSTAVANIELDAQSKKSLENLQKLKLASASRLADIHQYLCEVVAWRDDVHPVRVAITLRTKGYEGSQDDQALKNARNMLGGGQADTPSNWSGEHVDVRLGTEQYGPFYNVMLNGHGVKDTVAGHLGVIWNALEKAVRSDSGESPDKSVLHFVYSAYGLSGAGKTYALLKGDDSILQAIVSGHALSSVCGHAEMAIDLSIMDVYGEMRDEQMGTECSGMQARKHVVAYTDAAFGPRDLEEPGAFIKYDAAKSEVAHHAWIRLQREGNESEKDGPTLNQLPYIIQNLTKAKQKQNFAAKGDPPIFHIRATPNNKESSRAHTAITIRFSARDHEIARITLLDMAGSEDVDAIHNAYRTSINVCVVKLAKPVTLANAQKIPIRGGARQSLEKLLQNTLDQTGPCNIGDGKGMFPTQGSGYGDKVEGIFKQVRDQHCTVEKSVTPVTTMRWGPWLALYDQCKKSGNTELAEHVITVLMCPPSIPQMLAILQTIRDLEAATRLWENFCDKFPESNVFNVFLTKVLLKQGGAGSSCRELYNLMRSGRKGLKVGMPTLARGHAYEAEIARIRQKAYFHSLKAIFADRLSCHRTTRV